MKYVPYVNDYVTWTRGVEGWVYFKDKDYITIEVSVRPKKQGCPLHQNYHILVLCYCDQWEELTYVKSRESVYEEEKNNVEVVGKGIGRESI